MTQEHPSPQSDTQGTSRREFLRWTGAVAAGSALLGVGIPRVHAGENNTIRLALIGCGGRGSGAVGNAMNSPFGPVKLYAMADVVEDRLTGAHKALSEQFGDRVDVPKERQFVGFDAYKKAIDCLGPNDVAMVTSFAYVRSLQLEYAVKKGVNVFMEKSFGPDAPALRRLIQAGEEAKKKNLKIAAGLQCRHSVNRQELIKRIREGELGDLILVRAYRIHPAGGLGRETGRCQRADVADPQFHQFPVGLRRTLRRDEHPPDRRTLLAQGRLPGDRPRHRWSEVQQPGSKPGTRLPLH